MMKISAICPVYNEEKYVEQLINFFLISMPLEKELLLVDGNSIDGTRSIIEKYCNKYPDKIKLIDNPKKYVPFALNTAIVNSESDIIVRLDAHTIYNPDYFIKVIEAFANSGADIVGGAMRIAKGTDFQMALGYATSVPFGIGNSSFHFEDFEGFTDSVYLGAWKRGIFKITGYFDETLKRNQDDEFHYRAKNLGLLVYQSKEIKSYYFPRENLYKLSSQYFQYGLYKPRVLKKVKSALRLRHLIPALFVIYIVSLPFVFWMPVMRIPLYLYILLTLYFSFVNVLSVKQKFHNVLVFPMLHLSYGSGFILGLLKK